MPINSFLYPAPSTPTFPYNVANSCRFNPGSSDTLSRTLSTPTNNKKFTFSFWTKKCENGREQHVVNGVQLLLNFILTVQINYIFMTKLLVVHTKLHKFLEIFQHGIISLLQKIQHKEQQVQELEYMSMDQK